MRRKRNKKKGLTQRAQRARRGEARLRIKNYEVRIKKGERGGGGVWERYGTVRKLKCII
jgi:hypothetical protein